jgi:putative ABC transport system permease protein
MMADRHATNRAMFWRIIRRLFGANPGRLFVMLLALGAGAAVTAALLNLQVDAKRRLTTEFRAFGPNVVIVPHESSEQTLGSMLDQSLLDRIPDDYDGAPVTKIGLIYVIVSAYPRGYSFKDGPRRTSNAVLVGMQVQNPKPALPGNRLQDSDPLTYKASVCKVGLKAASALHVKKGDILDIANGISSDSCYVLAGDGYGSAEDNQILTDLEIGQHLAGTSNRISQIQLIVSGRPQQIGRFVAGIQHELTDAEVRPIRQFTEGEAKIYNRISGLLTATVAIVLVLTGLCVMAAMTNVAMERKNDVGLMKAIGGSVRRVLRLFLAEAALLGLAGGMIGAAVGIFLSIVLGKAVFGVAARPRLIVYPVAVALTIIVAIISAYPLRRLASIRPASVFRGEA